MSKPSPAELLPYPARDLTAEEMLVRAQRYLETARLRRTVRDFSDRSVAQPIIETCLQVAGTAPSGANLQPWHFVAISNPETKKRIRQAAEREEHEFYHSRAPQAWLDALVPFGTDEHKPFLETAPWLIAIFAEAYSQEGNEKHKNYYVSESVGIATGMLLAALNDCGLATLTHTPSPMRFLNDILQRPMNERPYLLLVVGYPAERCTVPKLTKKALSEIATFRT